MNVIVLAPRDFAALSRLESLPSGVNLTIGTDAASFGTAIRDADAILLAPRYGTLLGEVVPRASRLRWIHALAAGVETLPFDMLRERGIVVTNSAGLYADALGEFAIAAMLYFAKGLRRLVENQRIGRWEPFTVDRLEGKTVGIIGYGGIGRAIGRRAAGMGMRVLAMRSRPSERDGVVSQMFAPEEIDALLAQCDYVAISTPLTIETRGLVDRRRIAAMKAGAVVINVSRGAVIDEIALIDALRSGSLRGAALDVYEAEPLPAESPLWTLENVLVSPHSADHTADAHERAMEFFLANFARFRAGEPLENVVDLVAGY
jgi:phosphoglycerate dehydrogenase-like enzyme